MTKSNNEWVPEVEFPTGKGWIVVDEPDVNGVIIVRKESGEYRRVLKENVRPIKTEAEKRRDEQLHQMQIDGFRGYGYSLASHTEVKICKNILDAGWLKPKPLTESVIDELWRKSLTYSERVRGCDEHGRLFAEMIEQHIIGVQK